MALFAGEIYDGQAGVGDVRDDLDRQAEVLNRTRRRDPAVGERLQGPSVLRVGEKAENGDTAHSGSSDNPGVPGRDLTQATQSQLDRGPPKKLELGRVPDQRIATRRFDTNRHGVPGRLEHLNQECGVGPRIYKNQISFEGTGPSRSDSDLGKVIHDTFAGAFRNDGFVGAYRISARHVIVVARVGSHPQRYRSTPRGRGCPAEVDQTGGKALVMSEEIDTPGLNGRHIRGDAGQASGLRFVREDGGQLKPENPARAWRDELFPRNHQPQFVASARHVCIRPVYKTNGAEIVERTAFESAVAELVGTKGGILKDGSPIRFKRDLGSHFLGRKHRDDGRRSGKGDSQKCLLPHGSGALILISPFVANGDTLPQYVIFASCFGGAG